MKTVELHNAYVWQCEECGTENFVRAIVLENETAKELFDLDDPPDIMGQWTTRPNTVVCVFCKTQFTAKDWREDGDNG